MWRKTKWQQRHTAGQMRCYGRGREARDFGTLAAEPATTEAPLRNSFTKYVLHIDGLDQRQCKYGQRSC